MKNINGTPKKSKINTQPLADSDLKALTGKAQKKVKPRHSGFKNDSVKNMTPNTRKVGTKQSSKLNPIQNNDNSTIFNKMNSGTFS